MRQGHLSELVGID